MSSGVEPGDAILQHANVVEIDGRGILIRGPSGSGKTALAIELLTRSRACGITSALVADDYVMLSRDRETGALAAEAPERIAGLIELRGFGIVAVAPERRKRRTTPVLAVVLVPPAEEERVADPARRATFAGVDLPELALRAGSPVSCAHAVFGWLGLSGRIL